MRQSDPVARDSQIVRLLAVLHAMTQTKRGVVLKQLAERKGWPLRALYRDMKALEAAGFPVGHEHGRYWLVDGWTPPTAAGVSQREMLALFVARHINPGLKGTSFGKSLDSLWSKLSSTGPQAQLLPDQETPFATRTTASIDYSAHHESLEVLKAAIAGRTAVRISYRTPAGDVTDRVIEPGFLHWDGGLEAMYVPSWCRLRGDIRVFAVHRIQSIEALDDASTMPPGARSRRALERAFRVWYREQVEHVVILFMPPVAGEIRERTWHGSQRLVDDPAGGVYLHLDIAAPEELERWILGFGAAARVVVPDRLAARIHRQHVEAAALGTVVPASQGANVARERGQGVAGEPPARRTTKAAQVSKKGSQS
jgi:predicted DNA-binding transcriptional regulator YafY